MGVSLVHETMVFLWSCVGGMLTGVLFDSFRAWRMLKPSSTKIVGMQDLFFWIFSAALLFGLITITNEGQLRGYEFIGIILGGVIYFLWISAFVLSFWRTLIRMICFIIQWIIKLIFNPIFQLLGWIFKMIRGIICFCGSILGNFLHQTGKRGASFCANKIKKHLKKNRLNRKTNIEKF